MNNKLNTERKWINTRPGGKYAQKKTNKMKTTIRKKTSNHRETKPQTKTKYKPNKTNKQTK